MYVCMYVCVYALLCASIYFFGKATNWLLITRYLFSLCFLSSFTLRHASARQSSCFSSVARILFWIKNLLKNSIIPPPPPQLIWPTKNLKKAKRKQDKKKRGPRAEIRFCHRFSVAKKKISEKIMGKEMKNGKKTFSIAAFFILSLSFRRQWENQPKQWEIEKSRTKQRMVHLLILRHFSKRVYTYVTAYASLSKLRPGFWTLN